MRKTSAVAVDLLYGAAAAALWTANAPVAGGSVACERAQFAGAADPSAAATATSCRSSRPRCARG